MNLSNYLPLFVDLMLKSAAVAGLAGLAAWSCRRASAANRNLIWLAAFGALLVLPFTVAWLPREERGAAEPGAVIVLNLPAETTAPLMATRTVAAAEPASGLSVVTGWFRDNGRDGMVGLWLGVAGLLLAWRMIGAGRLRLLRRRSRLAENTRIAVWASRISAELGVRRRLEFRISDDCPVAMTWGTLRPVVMLPADALTWSGERLELVLRHELAHVRRGDCLVRLLSQVACALYWPNPLVWMGARRLRLAQEQACDDRVLAAGAQAGVYASELLAGARALSGWGGHGAAVAMAEPSTLEKRILGIVDEARDRSGARRLTVAFATMAAVLALAGGMAVQVRAAQESAVPPATKAKVYQQVEIAVRFMAVDENPEEAMNFLATLEEDAAPGRSSETMGYLAADKLDAALLTLSRQMGTDLLSAPKVTVLDGNRASIAVAQELRFPISWERAADASPALPKEFDARNVGVITNVLPRVTADGSVELDLHCVVRENDGFADGSVDAAGRLVAASALRHVFPAAVGSTEPRAALPEHFAMTPVFSETEAKAALRLRSGRAVVLLLGDRKRVAPAASGDWAVKAVKPTAPADRLVLAFVTATVLGPVVEGPKLRAMREAAERGEAPPPPPGTTITEATERPNLFRP